MNKTRTRILRDMWYQLHAKAVQFPFEPTTKDQQEVKAFLRDWAKQFPNGCKCRREWGQILKICPPDLSSQKAFFWWTVAAHDRVNILLSKPTRSVTLDHPLLVGVVSRRPAPPRKQAKRRKGNKRKPAK